MFSPDALRVEFRGRGRVALLAPLRWRTTTTHVVVPKGFQTDGATIPAILWPLVGHPLSGSILRAATLHDYELTTRHAPSRVIHRRFYDALRSSGVGRVRAALFYAGVRWFGPRFRANPSVGP
jgi:hypothetical protein